MSVALQSRPVHQCWHDMESSFWLLLFVTLRHVQGVEVAFGNRIHNPKRGDDREEVLQRIFHPYPNPRGNALDGFSKSKNEFLLGHTTFMEENAKLKSLLRALYRQTAIQYRVFHEIQLATDRLRSTETSLGLPKLELPLQNVYMARGRGDLRNQLSGLTEMGGKCKKRLRKLLCAHGVVTTISPSEMASTIWTKAEKLVRDSKLDIFDCNYNRRCANSHAR